MSKTKNVPIVSTKMGKISGIESETIEGRPIYAYKGIPFAKPPLGPLRFMRPEPLDEPWSDVHDGSRYSQPCRHLIKLGYFSFMMGSEDCLTLNVYVPKNPKKPQTGPNRYLLPVMVWIHGGGFLIGEATDMVYGPNHLLDRDIILVTVQYRLGPLGFFSLGTDEVSGNQGLWDQVEALRWVKSNIESFGGDNRRVTLFGESAGGMSVASHLMTDSTIGLFKMAIVQSGTLTSSFSMVDEDRPLSEFHWDVAEAAGCPRTSNSENTLHCLQSLSSDALFDHAFMFDECNILATEMMAFPGIWRPQNDQEFARKPFFPEDYRHAIKEGRFANNRSLVMVGFTKDDGIINTALLHKRPEKVQFIKDNWDKCMGNNFFGRRFSDQTDDHLKWSAAVQDFYLSGLKDPAMFDLETAVDNMTNIFTDATFGVGSDRLVRSRADHVELPVYYYRYDHVNSFSAGDVFSSDLFELLKILFLNYFGFDASKGLGVSHSDELLMLFSSKIKGVYNPTKDDAMRRLLVDLWVNFAVYKNPTPYDQHEKRFIGDSLVNIKQAWPKADAANNYAYALLRDGKVIVQRDPEMDERIKFMSRVFEGLNV